MKSLATEVGGSIWWLDPAKLIAFFVMPLYLVVYFAPELLGQQAVNVDYRVYLNGYYFTLGLVFLIAALLGAIGGKHLYPRAQTGLSRLPIKTLFLEVLAVLALLAYLLWFRNVLLKPWLIVEMIMEGAIRTSRLEHQTIGGVTTLTQLGIAYVILFLDRIWRAKTAPLPRRFYWYLWIIVTLAALRVYVWAERLALIEVVVPMIVVYLIHHGLPRSRTIKLLVYLAPLLGIGALLTYFAATEYFRSWSSFYRYQQDPFSVFITKRLLTYYYTALNNGAGMLAVLDWPNYRFEHTLQWMYRFPFLIGSIFRFTLEPQFQPSGFLARYADPEFNNMSGIYTVFYDVGIGGALLYAVLWGCACGYLYNSCRIGAGIGRALYPLVFISLLEALRLLYLSEPRAFPAIVALALGYALARERGVMSEVAYVKLHGKGHRVVGARGWLMRKLGSAGAASRSGPR